MASGGSNKGEYHNRFFFNNDHSLSDLAAIAVTLKVTADGGAFDINLHVPIGNVTTEEVFVAAVPYSGAYSYLAFIPVTFVDGDSTWEMRVYHPKGFQLASGEWLDFTIYNMENCYYYM